jgi:hypothetical protein
MKTPFFAGNKNKEMLPLVACIILLCLRLYFYKMWQVRNIFILLYYINTLISGAIFYINYFVLLPRFFFQEKRHKYFLSALILLIFFYFISDRSNALVFRIVSERPSSREMTMAEGERPNHRPPDDMRAGGPPPFRQMHLFNYTITSLFLLFFSMGLRVLDRQSYIERLQKEMEKEKLNSELAFLKNQISPHFFFNTLNNIYSLIGINADDSQKAVLKLSKLMRYLLYESEQGDTTLSSEIDFMNNYIDLMKLRMNDKVNLSVSFPKKYDDINIAPLLFIPFIENAFKHGISYRERSFIDISMKIFEDSLSFMCVNSIVKSGVESVSAYSGIGLENVRKRLTLLFPGTHDLNIDKSATDFKVHLQIKFK